MLKDTYYAFIHSHVLYGNGIEIYATAKHSYLDKLINLNNKLLRILQREPISHMIVQGGFLVPMYNKIGKSEQSVSMRYCYRSGHEILVGLSVFKLHSMIHIECSVLCNCVAVWRCTPLCYEENINVWHSLNHATTSQHLLTSPTGFNLSVNAR